MKINYFPLLFSSQTGARAVIIQEAKGRSGHRNLKWQRSQLKAQPVCNAGCEDEYEGMIGASLPHHSVTSLVIR